MTTETEPPKNSVPGCPAETLPHTRLTSVPVAAGLSELRRQIREQAAALARSERLRAAAHAAAIRAEVNEQRARDSELEAEQRLARHRGGLCSDCGAPLVVEQEPNKEAA